MKKIIGFLFLLISSFGYSQLDRATLLSNIDANINTNGTQKITGALLNLQLKQIVNSDLNKTSDPFVFSIGTGYGLLGGTITSTGTIRADTTKLITPYYLSAHSVQSSGTTDFIPRYTPNGTTLGDSWFSQKGYKIKLASGRFISSFDTTKSTIDFGTTGSEYIKLRNVGATRVTQILMQDGFANFLWDNKGVAMSPTKTTLYHTLETTVTGTTTLSLQSGQQGATDGTIEIGTLDNSAGGISGGHTTAINIGNSSATSSINIYGDVLDIGGGGTLTQVSSAKVQLGTQGSRVIADNPNNQTYLMVNGSNFLNLQYNSGSDYNWWIGNGNTAKFNWVGSTNVFTLTAPGTFAGVQYGADYSANYTSRSLIDKGYGDAAYLASGSGVTSVTGTSNRITSTGGTTPVIDISASYVGQSSITTTGTLTNGTASTGFVLGGVTTTLGSDATGDLYYRNSSGILTRLGIGSSNQLLQVSGGLPSWQTVSTGLTVGSTAIGSGTSGRVLYDNAGTLGEMTTSGSGTQLALTTTPTFGTNITTPLILGGTGTTQTLTYQTTSGVGAAGADHIFKVGNNGATQAMTILNDATIAIGTGTSTTNATKPLNIYGSIGSQLRLIRKESSGQYMDMSTGGGSVVFTPTATVHSSYAFNSNDGTNNFQRFIISQTGLIGIGINATSPTAWLEIGGAGNGSSAAWSAANQTTSGMQLRLKADDYNDNGTAGTRTSAVAVSIASPTLKSTNAVTVTDAASLYIADAPTAGTNTTLTRKWPLWVGAGISRFDGGIQFSSTGAAISNILTGTATLDFGSTSAQNSADLTITVTGAVDGDPVMLGVPNGSTLTNSSYSAFVSASNTVTVRFNNYSSGSQDPASGSFKISIIKN